MQNLVIAASAACMAAMLYWRYRSDALNARNGRGNIFNDCSALLTQVSETRETIGFPTLRGSVEDYPVMFEALVDTLSMRKVPPLWLTITVTGKQRTPGSLDVLVRPQNTEFYSPGWGWNGALPIPADWPQHAMVKYQGMPVSLEDLGNFVPELFSDEKVKELLITPTLVRITYLIKQGDRGEYLLMRNAAFDGLPIPKEAVSGLLHAAIDLRKKLEGALRT
ncbi:hypothetical protein C7W93_08435 [Glaciimonas sp. PCH181]|nr:hypothetical protein C7W93_08435 [Glaciimonas sp. PCH181]